MDSSVCKGRIKQWNDERGFGFIAPDGQQGQVFIHISALKKVGRRPVVGDIVHFELHTDANGKVRAVNVKIEGVAPVQRSAGKRVSQRSSVNYQWMVLLGAIALVLVAGVMLRDKPAEPSPITLLQAPQDSGNFRCSQDKIHCSQMNSCAEAKFHSHNCPGTKMDGDGDGIPCERQWCGG